MDNPTSDCGFATAIKVIGGKWKADILWELHVAPRRFGRLRKLILGISEKVLTEQLRQMEDDGIIARTVHSESPLRVVYSLTDHGKALNEGVVTLSHWGKMHESRATDGFETILIDRIASVA